MDGDLMLRNFWARVFLKSYDLVKSSVKCRVLDWLCVVAVNFDLSHFKHSQLTIFFFVDCHVDWTESNIVPAAGVYSDLNTCHLSAANPSRGSSRPGGHLVRCLLSSTYYRLSTLWHWLEYLMGFHVNVWVTGELIERDYGAVKATGTTHWSCYWRSWKETKWRKMTVDCLSDNNRCEIVHVRSIQTTGNPVILQSALSNITLEK